ncbi:uncharacterized protein EV422DRAFT_524861 [Fimicolochytrium jonesii]|uniref:uncharacterized protein n=1 Tax=Fimicolochytrium jonesii TaxID=1396493 RepID=UPI0022FED0B6|nr:uncharacterized protein EV422DRAFT_524861 [Fimicolochytrium jonesii]KAI8822651.1 hypothetical protein EV422DRAFT_524861 [Fimicolochytrium jonesii]
MEVVHQPNRPSSTQLEAPEPPYLALLTSLNKVFAHELRTCETLSAPDPVLTRKFRHVLQYAWEMIHRVDGLINRYHTIPPSEGRVIFTTARLFAESTCEALTGRSNENLGGVIRSFTRSTELSRVAGLLTQAVLGHLDLLRVRANTWSHHQGDQVLDWPDVVEVMEAARNIFRLLYMNRQMRKPYQPPSFGDALTLGGTGALVKTYGWDTPEPLQNVNGVIVVDDMGVLIGRDEDEAEQVNPYASASSKTITSSSESNTAAAARGSSSSSSSITTKSTSTVTIRQVRKQQQQQFSPSKQAENDSPLSHKLSSTSLNTKTVKLANATARATQDQWVLENLQWPQSASDSDTTTPKRKESKQTMQVKLDCAKLALREPSANYTVRSDRSGSYSTPHQNRNQNQNGNRPGGPVSTTEWNCAAAPWKNGSGWDLPTLPESDTTTYALGASAVEIFKSLGYGSAGSTATALYDDHDARTTGRSFEADAWDECGFVIKNSPKPVPAIPIPAPNINNNHHKNHKQHDTGWGTTPSPPRFPWESPPKSEADHTNNHTLGRPTTPTATNDRNAATKDRSPRTKLQCRSCKQWNGARACPFLACVRCCPYPNCPGH